MPVCCRLSLVCCLLLVLALPRVALAHAVLLGTAPEADSVLADAPSRIVIRFNEPVRPVLVRVLDAAGQVVADESAAQAVDTHLEITLPERLEEGGYIVSWRVISADSHPVGGSFRFAVGAVPAHWHDTGHGDASEGHGRFWTVAGAAVRTLFLLSLLTAAGATWFVVLIARKEMAVAEPAARLAAAAALTGAGTGALYVGVHGALLLVVVPGEFFAATPWRTGLGTPTGLAVLASAVALALSALLLALRAWRGAAVAASFAALAAVFTLATAGHAATASPRLLMAPAIALHACVAAFWFGSLPPLLIAVRRLGGHDAAAILRRFSVLAVFAVGALVLAGTALALIQVERIEALWQTPYGLIFGAKLALVAGVLALAVQNKRALTPALAAGERGAARRLSRNITLEIAGIAAVVALTATLAFTTPPRALLTAENHGSHGHGEHHRHHPSDVLHDRPVIERHETMHGTTATIRITPGLAGRNTVTVLLEDEAGAAVQPMEITARFFSPELGIEPVERTLERRGDRYLVETADMSIPGGWRIRLDVLVSDFEKHVIEMEFGIR